MTIAGSPQLKTQLLQLRKKKKTSGLYEIWTLYLCDTSATSFHEPIQRPAPSWHVSPVGTRAAPVSQRSRVRISYKPDFFFSGFLFAVAKFACISAMIYFHIIIIHLAVHIYDFHIFITSLSVRLIESQIKGVRNKTGTKSRCLFYRDLRSLLKENAFCRKKLTSTLRFSLQGCLI